ncbi:MAG: hypothetical protein A2747_02635 [Candidatus Yonathbacteria bacterium RIFCSPHIGHO2_01_FULL_44_41]|uniref:Uncharacterized protein n=1 Tax=Candidatus Yonathbacteria bacterium RIFCSPHIGHO2_02_FULL_44_14 TaxID=1802724 RepID=A0A1G2S8I9_9BACT|nr:MAG: hypothetical protein A2747_02635 [Candidatus Yonathbacteria bacterium RIFCSPHIGHO2_01_FULL_44_41]OHA80591.1 MAG: hypothetical protein A3D51_00755 [Candidatus Yonathbacteria bacterium RIFCSPHIGHO2_02_FULL_44_14]OHA82117.1 MAG: hypothetical protein A3B06_01240 [Candidatus Yonathbacteria bacterium RIFCSPLOWO2_01_FULL_43_20]
MKNINQFLKIVLVALTLSIGVGYAFAWTVPTATPPVGNVAAPINVSGTSQYKGDPTAHTGGLGIEGLIRGYSNAIFDGKVGIGTTNPSSQLQIKSPDPILGNIGFGDLYGNIWSDGGIDKWFTIRNISVGGRTSFFNDTTTEIMTLMNSGNVGIGKGNPNVKLDVAGGVRTGSETQVTVCSASTEGTQRYNYTTHAPEFCNGTAWTSASGSGGGFSNVTTYSAGANPGVHKACFMGYFGAANGGDACGVSGTYNGTWTISYYKGSCVVTCID